jgi:hypothetical protein
VKTVSGFAFRAESREHALSLTPRQEKAIEKLTDTIAGAVCGVLLWVIVWYIDVDLVSARLLLLLVLAGASLGLLFGETGLRPARNIIEQWWERW